MWFSDTAFAMNKDNDKWYYFDDSSVSLGNEDQIVVSCPDHFSGQFMFLHINLDKKCPVSYTNWDFKEVTNFLTSLLSV